MGFRLFRRFQEIAAVWRHAIFAQIPLSQLSVWQAYDEMFTPSGVPRPHSQALYRTLLQLPAEDLRKSQQAADLSFLHQGITFTA